MDEQFIILFGNPVDGIEPIGTFDSAESAEEYADRWLRNGGDYWIVMLQKPAKEGE